ncbi:hypothetical protein C8R46DRAFT_1055825 [Mycena filopes]|nr:hypothetical protein C8R46DRAFT_1055825 [Mycena filopes]
MAARKKLTSLYPLPNMESQIPQPLLNTTPPEVTMPLYPSSVSQTDSETDGGAAHSSKHKHTNFCFLIITVANSFSVAGFRTLMTTYFESGSGLYLPRAGVSFLATSWLMSATSGLRTSNATSSNLSLLRRKSS